MSKHSLFELDDVPNLSPQFFNEEYDKVENEIIKHVARIYQLTERYEFQKILSHTDELEVLVLKFELLRSLIETVGKRILPQFYPEEIWEFLQMKRPIDESVDERKNLISKSIITNSVHIMKFYNFG